ncbi:MAG: type III pantothenate kinase [Cytophagales bacterium]|nr:type III pantothenate kinase [Cytophagales bacterium]
MNIAVDFGNTSVKAGYFDHDTFHGMISATGPVELIRIINENLDSKVVMSTVNSDAIHFVNLIENKDRLLILKQDTPIPIQNLYTSPATLGSDRLAAAIAAAHLYPHRHCLVIDAGTCITYDYLSSAGEYHGGSISPGVGLRFKALHQFTGALPLIAQPYTDYDVSQYCGQDTTTSIMSGVLQGAIGEMTYFIDIYKKKYPDITIIITGGNHHFFESRILHAIFAVPELILIGLNRVLIYNELR